MAARASRSRGRRRSSGRAVLSRTPSWSSIRLRASTKDTKPGARRHSDPREASPPGIPDSGVSGALGSLLRAAGRTDSPARRCRECSPRFARMPQAGRSEPTRLDATTRAPRGSDVDARQRVSGADGSFSAPGAGACAPAVRTVSCQHGEVLPGHLRHSVLRARWDRCACFRCRDADADSAPTTDLSRQGDDEGQDKRDGRGEPSQPAGVERYPVTCRRLS